MGEREIGGRERERGQSVVWWCSRYEYHQHTDARLDSSGTKHVVYVGCVWSVCVCECGVCVCVWYMCVGCVCLCVDKFTRERDRERRHTTAIGRQYTSTTTH
jgi:hypothetical protein